VIPLRLDEAARLAGGALVGADAAALVSGPVVVDSRAVVPGALFVAIKGERVDGHDYAAAAVEAGAVAVLADRALPGLASIVVAQPVPALGLLARGVLDRLPGVRVVGLTGSSGKTSTKDLVATLLSSAGETVAPPGSYNTEIGLPLTVLQAGTGTAFLVLELGARGIGHIRYLTSIAPPQVGVVLNVGSAHLGEFGSREAIATAKGELVEALPAGGLAVLSADDALVAAMAGRTAARVVTFGLSPAADVRAEELTMASGRAGFRLVAPQGAAPVRLRLVGEHQVQNALAAAAVALDAGLGTSEVAGLLSAAEPRSRWRMEVTERADGVTVVNDAYNANPESMRAALRALVAIAGGRRSWAVLGEMRELGAAADAEHGAIGRLAAELGIDRVVVVGPLGAAIHGAGSSSSVMVADIAAALDLLRAELEPGDVVLVKASRAAGLERVAGALLEEVAA
jgi:UDP-N-acetylmuramoyl-tripeptide--D-alanyl-D-alanine ligase